MSGIGGIRLERRLKGALNRRVGRQVRTRRGAALSVAVTVVLFVLYALVLGRGAAWLDGSSLRGLTASQRASEVDTMRGYLIQVGAGVLAAGALIYTALNFQLAREGHVTDRYTKAIEQLGSDRLDVRLGAIYALERIMLDSDRDHPTIVEVLAAFVREHSLVAATPPEPDKNGVTRLRPGPETDTQAALTVLGRRPAGRDERGRLNLSNAYLVGANLTKANLADADLNNANLNHAYFGGADLSRAHLNGANLTYAALGFRVNLNGAYLIGANLTSANLTAADLTDAVLMDANLTDVDLARVGNLAGADLTRVTLTDQQRSVVRGWVVIGVKDVAPLTGISPQEQQPQQ